MKPPVVLAAVGVKVVVLLLLIHCLLLFSLFMMFMSFVLDFFNEAHLSLLLLTSC